MTDRAAAFRECRERILPPAPEIITLSQGSLTELLNRAWDDGYRFGHADAMLETANTLLEPVGFGPIVPS